MITAGVSVPVQIPSQGPPDLGPNYWPRLQWSSFFGLPPLGKFKIKVSCNEIVLLICNITTNRKSIIKYAILCWAGRSEQKNREWRLKEETKAKPLINSSV